MRFPPQSGFVTMFVDSLRPCVVHLCICEHSWSYGMHVEKGLDLYVKSGLQFAVTRVAAVTAAAAAAAAAPAACCFDAAAAVAE